MAGSPVRWGVPGARALLASRQVTSSLGSRPSRYCFGSVCALLFVGGICLKRWISKRIRASPPPPVPEPSRSAPKKGKQFLPHLRPAHLRLARSQLLARSRLLAPPKRLLQQANPPLSIYLRLIFRQRIYPLQTHPLQTLRLRMHRLRRMDRHRRIQRELPRNQNRSFLNDCSSLSLALLMPSYSSRSLFRQAFRCC